MRQAFLLSSVMVASIICSTAVHADVKDSSLTQKYESESDKMVEKSDFAGALVQLKNARKADPQNANIRIKLAFVELRLTDFEGALIDLNAARQYGGDEAKIGPLLGQAYIAQGKYEEVLRDVPVREDSSSDERAATLVLRAKAFMALHRLPEADAALQLAVQYNPSSIEAKLTMARLELASKSFDAANKIIDQLLQQAPSAEAHYLKSQIFAQSNDIASSLSELNAALAGDSNDISALVARAQVFIAQNQDGKADADIKKALSLSPRAVGPRYFQALLLARAKDYAGADDILTKYANGFSQFTQGYFLQAVVKSTLKEYEQAEAAINLYLASAPDDVRGLKIQAQIMMQLGDFVGAANLLERMASKDPADSETLTLLGQAYRPINAYKSTDAFQRATKFGPDNGAAFNGLALNNIAKGQTEAAAAELQKVTELAPNDTSAADALMLLYLQQGKYDDAAKLIASELQKRPDQPTLVDANGLVNLGQGHIVEAKAIFLALEKKHPEFLPAKLQLANLYSREGKSDQARSEYEDILLKDPANLAALREISKLILGQGKPASLIDLWKKALHAQPDNLELATGLVKAYLANQDTDGALSVVRDMLVRKPNEARLFGARAELEIKAGKPKDALVSRQRVVELEPESPVAFRNLALLEDNLGDHTAAADSIAAARKLDPASVMLAADEVRIVGASDPQRGIAAARKAAAILSDSPAAQAIEGDYLLFLKRPAEAIASFQTAFQAAPSLLMAERLAQSLSKSGKPDDGEKIMADWASAHADDAAAKFAFASLLESDKKFVEAKGQYEAFLKQAPDNPMALNNLAGVYHRLGDERALDTAQKAHLAAPDNFDIDDTLGWIMVQKNIPGALAFLQWAHNGAPDDLDIQYHLAYALNREGSKNDAIALLKSALSQTNDFQSKPDARALLSQLSR